MGTVETSNTPEQAAMNTIKNGDVVRPNHNGTKVNWTKLRGRVVRTWVSAGTAGEPVAQVVWFGAARNELGAYSNGYPLAMLERA
jgi:hypothetical protein